MKRNLKFIWLIACFLPFDFSMAQTDVLKLYDLVVVNEYSPAAIKPGETLKPAVLPDLIPYKVVFKLGDVPKLSKVYIKVGKVKDDGSLLSTELLKTQTGTDFLLQNAGGSYKIWGNSAFYQFKLPKAQKDIKWLTIYVTDEQGIVSEKKYYKF